MDSLLLRNFAIASPDGDANANALLAMTLKKLGCSRSAFYLKLGIEQ
ncbi:MAG: hypothetical protein ACFB02_15565 [Mastigocoleus sp.]